MLLLPTAPFPTTTTLIAVSISSTIVPEGKQCSWISSQHQMCFRVKCFVVDKDRPRYVMIMVTCIVECSVATRAFENSKDLDPIALVCYVISCL